MTVKLRPAGPKFHCRVPKYFISLNYTHFEMKGHEAENNIHTLTMNDDVVFSRI